MIPGSKHLAALLAASGASALQIPLQFPLHLPAKLGPWHSADVGDSAVSKHLIDSEKLQAMISGDNLMKRAKELYHSAQSSEDEFNHPTRVIGSEGA